MNPEDTFEEEEILIDLKEEDFVSENSHHIKYNEIKAKLPDRNSFVDKDLRSHFEDNMSKGGKIAFMPVDIVETTHGKRYCVNIFGFMPCGTKVMVVVKNIPLYFDVKVPKEEPKDVLTQSVGSRELPQKDPEQFLTILRGVLTNSGHAYDKLEIVKGYPLKGFQIHPSYYIRVHFNLLWERQKCIKNLSDRYELASDDNGPGAYFLKIARDYKFNTAGWNKIEGRYTTKTYKEFNHYKEVSKCDFCIYASIENIKPANEVAIATRGFLKQPKGLLMTWDIETYTMDTTGKVPEPGDPNYWIFMISATFHWYYEDNALLKVCLVDAPTQVRDGIFYSLEQLEKVKGLPKEERNEMLRKMSRANYLIECGSERKLLEAFGDVIAKMKPDIISAFNGGNFDWTLVRDRMKHYKMLGEFKEKISALPNNKSSKWRKTQDESVYEYSFKREKVKITPEDYHYMLCLNVPGILDLDVMPIFRQIHPREEVGMKQSLNFYLKINGLGSKVDLPYKQMFRYYEASLLALKKGKDLTKSKQLMSIVAEYCVVDAFRCQQLLMKRNVINERREIAMSSYVRLYEAFYRGNGIKVRNLAGAYCYDMGILFSNSKVNNRKIKYPGAHVFPPKKGLNNKRPVTGVDFSSLYPSLMMAYDLSPEKAIIEESEEDVAYARKLENMGYILYRIEFTGVAEDTGEKVEVKGWVVRHSNVIEEGDHPTHMGKKLDRPALPGEKMGLFPYILKTLFDRRKAIKNRMNRIKILLEAMKKESDYEKISDSLFEGTGYTRTNADMEDMKFTIKMLDAKQGAMKVNMNTFYGEQGNHLSTIYMLIIAGAITQAGKYNIKLVSNLLKDLGYTVHYGDSVLGDTPVLCKAPNGTIGYRRIDDLGSQFGFDTRGKEVSDCDYQVWSDKGWTPIKKVIRHKTNKKIYRITTGTGCVDATEDHSLLDPKGNKVRPEEVSFGQSLLHSDLPLIEIGKHEEEFIKKHYGRDTKNKMIASNLFHYWTAKGHTCHIYVEGDYYRIMVGKHGATDTVRSIELLAEGTENYVYDLETENHHFSAGVGRLVVHNTDSNYVSSPDALFKELDDIYCETQEIVKAKTNNSEETGFDAHINMSSPMETYQKNIKVISNEYKATGDLKALVISVSLAYREFANAMITLIENHKGATARTWQWLALKLKEQYWVQLVQITRKDISVLKDFINKTLEKDNGTPYLKMAYEEVLFPVIFLGKKKYFGYQHLENENFYPEDEDIFIKGVDIIKQGQSDLAKEIGMRIIRKCCSVECSLDIEELVIEELKNIYSQNWNQEAFVLKAKYKPDKKNVAVQTFVKRMKEMRQNYLEQAEFVSQEESERLKKLANLYTPPKPGDTFEYIIVNKGHGFNGRGNKIKPNKGDKMEYFEVFKYWNQVKPGSMIWDLNHYMSGAILGLFARFISYKEEFQPPKDKFPFKEDATDKEEIERLKKIDANVINKAKTYLNNISLKFAGIDTEAVRQQNLKYQRMFRDANRVFKGKIDPKEVFLMGTVQTISKTKKTTEQELIKKNYEKISNKIMEESEGATDYLRLINKLEEKKPVDYLSFKERYGSHKFTKKGGEIVEPKRVIFERKKKETMEEIMMGLPEVVKIIRNNESSLEEILLKRREEGEISEEVIQELINNKDTSSRETLNKFYALITRAISIQRLINYYTKVADELEERANKKMGIKKRYYCNATKEAKRYSENSEVIHGTDKFA